MTEFRKDLKDKTAALNTKLTQLMGDMRRIDRRIAEGVAWEISDGTETGVGQINNDRTRIWDEIRQTKAAIQAVEDEKNAVLTEAGLSLGEVPFHLAELPNTAEELNIRLHGTREPRRTELTEKLIAAGMIAPRRKPISVWGYS